MKRSGLAQAACPVARSLSAVGDGWSLLIVRDIALGLRRFSEIQRNLGIAKNILAARLRALTETGILVATPGASGCAYQEYILTEKGQDLVGVLRAFIAWGERWTLPDSAPCAGEDVHIFDAARAG